MRPLFTALSLAAALAALPATAATYDAFSTFNGTATGGAFTYGTLDDTAATPTFTAFNDAPGCAGLISNVICTSNGFLPAAFKSTSGAHQSGSVIVPGDALILHPGSSAGQSAAVLFTAPTAGKYLLSFSASVADTNPSGTVIEAFSSAGTLTPIATLSGATPTFGFSSFPLTFVAGDTVGFAVNYAGSYFNDSTGINVTLTTVPEPAAWTLLIAGFAMTGFAARRRRVALTA